MWVKIHCLYVFNFFLFSFKYGNDYDFGSAFSDEFTHFALKYILKRQKGNTTIADFYNHFIGPNKPPVHANVQLKLTSLDRPFESFQISEFLSLPKMIPLSFQTFYFPALHVLNTSFQIVEHFQPEEIDLENIGVTAMGRDDSQLVRFFISIAVLSALISIFCVQLFY